MLTSRIAEQSKRDRLNAKGKDGGSFIPRAVVIKGKAPVLNTNIMVIAPPSYITIDNLLHAQLIIKVPSSNENGDSVQQWFINSVDPSGTDSNYRNTSYFNTGDSFNSEPRFIFHLGSLIDSNTQKDYIFTIFYKG